MTKQVVIITGPCSSGKLTIAKELANEVKNSAYVEADEIRHMIKNGYALPHIYKGESKKQVDLGTKNVIDITNNFLKSGFNVFIEDILERKQQLDSFKKYIKGKLKIILLMPNKNTLKKRAKERRGNDKMGKRALELYDIFSKKVDKTEWHIIDTSNHSINQTKREIIKIIK